MLHDPEQDQFDGYAMSGIEAMVGATLALMTGHAQCECAVRRRLMAHKVRSHLHFLAGHPELSPALRQVAAQVCSHWEPMCLPIVGAAHDRATGPTSVGVNPALPGPDRLVSDKRLLH